MLQFLFIIVYSAVENTKRGSSLFKRPRLTCGNEEKDLSRNALLQRVVDRPRCGIENVKNGGVAVDLCRDKVLKLRFPLQDLVVYFVAHLRARLQRVSLKRAVDQMERRAIIFWNGKAKKCHRVLNRFVKKKKAQISRAAKSDSDAITVTEIHVRAQHTQIALLVLYHCGTRYPTWTCARVTLYLTFYKHKHHGTLPTMIA